MVAYQSSCILHCALCAVRCALCILHFCTLLCALCVACVAFAQLLNSHVYQLSEWCVCGQLDAKPRRRWIADPYVFCERNIIQRQLFIIWLLDELRLQIRCDSAVQRDFMERSCITSGSRGTLHYWRATQSHGILHRACSHQCGWKRCVMPGFRCLLTRYLPASFSSSFSQPVCVPQPVSFSVSFSRSFSVCPLSTV